MNTQMKKMEFRVYEIEHDDDLGDAISELQRYGAESVNILSIDFEDTESVKFEVIVPESKIQGFIVDVKTQMCV